MDLLLHDIAVAIERDCTPPPRGHWAWANAPILDEHEVERHDHDLRGTTDQELPGVTR